MMFRRLAALIAATVLAMLGLTLPASAAPSSLQVCNSPSSPASSYIRLSSTAHETNGTKLAPGACASGNNSSGQLRILITWNNSGASYAKGQDGIGYGACTALAPQSAGAASFSDPVNDPVNGIIRIKTWSAGGQCHVTTMHNVSLSYTLGYWTVPGGSRLTLAPGASRDNGAFAVDNDHCQQVYDGGTEALTYGGGYHQLPQDFRRAADVFADPHNGSC